MHTLSYNFRRRLVKADSPAFLANVRDVALVASNGFDISLQMYSSARTCIKGMRLQNIECNVCSCDKEHACRIKISVIAKLFI